MIEAVLFDFWDTLIFCESRENRRLRRIRIRGLTETLVGAGFSVSQEAVEKAMKSVDSEYDRVGGETGRDFDAKSQVQMMMEILGVPKSNKRLSQNLWNIYARSILSVKLGTRDGAERVLCFLKERGHKIGLICNTGRTPGIVIREILRNVGLLQYFDVLMFSNEYGLLKPRPEIFLETLSRIDVEPSGAVHIGDRPDLDVLGAKNAGLKAIYLRLTNQPYPIVLPKPDLTIRTLHQIPKAIRKLYSCF